MYGHDLGQALGGNPHRRRQRAFAHVPVKPDARCTSRRGEIRHMLTHGSDFGVREVASRQQRIVHLVGIARVGPFFRAHPGDSRFIQDAQVVVCQRLPGAPGLNGLRPPLFQRRVVQKRVRSGVQNLVGERRGFCRVAGDELQFTAMDLLEHTVEAVEVHGLLKAVTNGLLHQGMVRDLAIARDVFEACGGIREYSRHEIVGEHPLQLRRDLSPAAAARHGERDGRVPPPAGLKNRRVEEGLDQHVTR